MKIVSSVIAMACMCSFGAFAQDAAPASADAKPACSKCGDDCKCGKDCKCDSKADKKKGKKGKKCCGSCDKAAPAEAAAPAAPAAPAPAAE